MGREFYAAAAKDERSRFQELAVLDMDGDLFKQMARIRAGGNKEISVRTLDAYMKLREQHGAPIITRDLTHPDVTKGSMYYAYGTGKDDKKRAVFNQPDGKAWTGKEEFVAQGTYNKDGKFVSVAVAKDGKQFFDGDGENIAGLTGDAFDKEKGLVGSIPKELQTAANRINPKQLDGYKAGMVATQKADATLTTAKEKQEKADEAYKEKIAGLTGVNDAVLKSPKRLAAAVAAGVIDRTVVPALNGKVAADKDALAAQTKLTAEEKAVAPFRPKGAADKQENVNAFVPTTSESTAAPVKEARLPQRSQAM
jgi:hypothetical protein